MDIYVDYHDIANMSGTHFTVASLSKPAMTKHTQFSYFMVTVVISVLHFLVN